MIKQRTIKEPIRIEGIGLQTGRPVTLNLKGAPADSGINFIRADLQDRPRLNIRDLAPDGLNIGSGRRTTLNRGGLEIQTTEHLLAALSGLSVDNITIEIDNIELPGLDGSAKGYCEALRKAGIIEQDAPRRFLKVGAPVWSRTDDGLLAAFPDDDFRISYTMSYKSASLGTHFFDIVVDEKSFERDIAPARTFCLKGEAAILLASGLGKGANFRNTLVMAKNGPVKNKLRFPDEPVRHKVLDLVGDLSLLGQPIKAHVVAIKSGHRLNLELVKKLKGLQPLV